MVLCAIPDNRHILSWPAKVAHGILVLDDGALALWNATLSEVAVVDVEWLVHRVPQLKLTRPITSKFSSYS